MDKKALDSIGKHPQPGRAEFQLLMVVSTAHVQTQPQGHVLDRPPVKTDSTHGVYVDDHEYGWWLVLADDEDPEAPWENEGLKNIATYARMIGATAVRIDADGPVVEGIPTFEHEPATT